MLMASDDDNTESFIVELIRTYTNARTKLEIRLAEYLASFQSDFENLRRKTLQKAIPVEIHEYAGKTMEEKRIELVNITERIVGYQTRINELNAALRNRDPSTVGIPINATIHIDIPADIAKSGDADLILDYVKTILGRCGDVSTVSIHHLSTSPG